MLRHQPLSTLLRVIWATICMPLRANAPGDRAYRIGQTRDVIVYRLISCGSVEEKIYRKQAWRFAALSQVLGVRSSALCLHLAASTCSILSARFALLSGGTLTCGNPPCFPRYSKAACHGAAPAAMTAFPSVTSRSPNCATCSLVRAGARNALHMNACRLV